MKLPPAPEDYGSRMPVWKEARNLQSVGRDSSGRDARLVPAAADAWHAMRRAAEGDGVELMLISAFRSLSRQRTILRRKVDSGVPWADILAVSAYPGFSEHHTGRAIDVGAPGCESLAESFERTRQFEWLVANAGRFGFALSYPRGNPSGIAYEPWHWLFNAGARNRSP